MANNYKTAQDFDMIEQGVKDVYSSDKFKNYLSCLSKFQMGVRKADESFPSFLACSVPKTK